MKVPDVQLSVGKPPNKMTYFSKFHILVVIYRSHSRPLSVVYYCVPYVTLECSVFVVSISDRCNTFEQPVDLLR